MSMYVVTTLCAKIYRQKFGKAITPVSFREKTKSDDTEYPELMLRTAYTYAVHGWDGLMESAGAAHPDQLGDALWARSAYNECCHDNQIWPHDYFERSSTLASMVAQALRFGDWGRAFSETMGECVWEDMMDYLESDMDSISSRASYRLERRLAGSPA